jgi:hypothetical protein
LGGVVAERQQTVSEEMEHSAAAQDSVAKLSPLSLSVAQAFYVGERLQVKVKLETKIKLPASQIVVSILGLKEGRIVEQHDQRLSAVTSDAELAPGAALLLPFELTVKDLSEYQIQCRWGKDAEHVAEDVQALPEIESSPDADAQPVSLAQPAAETTQRNEAESEPKAQALSDEAQPSAAEASSARASLDASPEKGVQIRDAELEEETETCATPPCDKRYTLRARVVNQGTAALSSIEIGVGLTWAEGNSLPVPPADFTAQREGEEAVRLGELVLHPGESKKLKIKISRAVPVVPGGAFLPYIRIIQAEKSGA